MRMFARGPLLFVASEGGACIAGSPGEDLPLSIEAPFRLLASSSAIASGGGCGTSSPWPCLVGVLSPGVSSGSELNAESEKFRLDGELELAPVSSAQPHPAIVPTRPFSLRAFSTRPNPCQSKNSKQLVRNGTIPSLTTFE